MSSSARPSPPNASSSSIALCSSSTCLPKLHKELQGNSNCSGASRVSEVVKRESGGSSGDGEGGKYQYLLEDLDAVLDVDDPDMESTLLFLNNEEHSAMNSFSASSKAWFQKELPSSCDSIGDGYWIQCNQHKKTSHNHISYYTAPFSTAL